MKVIARLNEMNFLLNDTSTAYPVPKQYDVN